MPPIIADTLGGIPQAYALDQDLRARAAAQIFSQLMKRRMELQEQKNWETAAQERMAQNAYSRQYNAAHLAESTRQADRNFGLNKDWQDWQMKQPTPEAVRATKAAEQAGAKAQEFGLRAVISGINDDGTLDENNPAFKSAHPMEQEVMRTEATRRRMELKPELDRRLQALRISRQAHRMEEVAQGIGDTKLERDRGLENQGSSPFAWPFSDSAQKQPADPQAIAADLRQKALKLKTDNQKLLADPNLVVDPKTKRPIAKFPAWYLAILGGADRIGTGLETGPYIFKESDRFVKPDNLPYDPRVPETSYPELMNRKLQIMQGGGQSPMTGTNQLRLPRYQKQGGTWFELQQDGSYAPVVR